MRCLHFYWRRLTRNTLPFTAGHLHPRVGPPLIIIEGLSHRIGALTVEASGHDGRIAKVDIFYEEHVTDGPPVLLLHGWPDDILGWRHLAPRLQTAGHQVIIPYLRGFGPTRFLSHEAIRYGRGVALAQDALDLADALGIRPSRLLATIISCETRESSVQDSHFCVLNKGRVDWMLKKVRLRGLVPLVSRQAASTPPELQTPIRTKSYNARAWA